MRWIHALKEMRTVVSVAHMSLRFLELPVFGLRIHVHGETCELITVQSRNDSPGSVSASLQLRQM